MSYIGTSPSNGVRKVHTYTATAGQTTFSGAGSENITLSYSDGTYVDVYQNGVLLGTADYTATSGTSIVLAQGASVNDIIVVTVYDIFSVADTVSKSDGGTFDGNVTMGGTLTLTGNGDFNGDLDVDGTTNLDNVDIDGTVDISSTLTVGGVTTLNGKFLIDGSNNDLMTFRTTGDTASQVLGLQFQNNSEAVTSQLFATGDNSSSHVFRIKSIGSIELHGGDVAVSGDATNMLKVDNNGLTTIPSQPHALVEKSSTTSVGTSAVVFVTFDEERVDTGSVYDTSNGRFTAPIDGRYLLSAELQANAQVNQLHVGFYLNGGGSIGSLDPWINFGDSVRGGTRTLAINLSAGDYLQVAAHFGSNSATLEANRQRASFYLLG